MQQHEYLSYDEFFDLIKTFPCQDYIVKIRYKYDWEKEWTVENEILEYYPSSIPIDRIDDNYVWLNDWFEGQQWVEIMGFMPLDEVEVPLWSKTTKTP